MGVEDDCVCPSPKLFVGQIPPAATRDGLESLFGALGRVQRIDMLTPRQLTITTRSAMIWFETWTDVERVLEAQDDDRFSVGSGRRLVIRIADPPKRGDNALGIKPRKLFIGQIPPEVPETAVRELFGQFGVIEEFEVPRRVSVVSCAFVRFHKWSQAESAIRDLNEKFTFPQSKRSLVVKFADAKMIDPKSSSSQLVGEKRPLTPEDRCDLAKRPYGCDGYGRKIVDPLDMGFLSTRMGWPMGMGTWTGMGRIEWIHDENKRFVQETEGSSTEVHWPPEEPKVMETCVEVNFVGEVVSTMPPPLGPNGKLGKGFSDPRVKEWTLFVGQIPHQAEEYALWDVFCPFGEILELNVLRKDGKHRGCAFVTYETRDIALTAISKLHGMRFPWDSNQRKLVVRFRERNTKI